eukprot:177060-Chlamydomonas_euryale.AAC.1
MKPLSLDMRSAGAELSPRTAAKRRRFALSATADGTSDCISPNARGTDGSALASSQQKPNG